MRIIKPIVVILFFSALAFGQIEGDDVINVDSSIVRLNVGVVNSTGRPITSLTKNSFVLYEDGVKQDIAAFEPTTAPFSLVMILDMSGSTTGFRQTIKMSAGRFVDALAPDDRVAVIEFYDKINVLNDFTTDRSKIRFSIDAANGKGKTPLFKALDLALSKLAREGNRRKAIIVLTDGVDSAARDVDRNILSKLSETDIPGAIKPDANPEMTAMLQNASNQGVTIFPLALPTGDPTKLPDPTALQLEMYSIARKRLDIIATRTGGQLNAINRLEEMGRLYAEVAANVRSLYTIEYQPQNTERDGKWREIKIELSMPDLITKTRPGYFAK